MRQLNSNGFTLVEVLVAFVALAIGMIAMLGLHIASARVQTSNQLQENALNSASQRLERYRSMSFAALASENTTVGKYTYNLVVNGGATPPSWRKDLTLTTSWQERYRDKFGTQRTATRQIVLSTYIVNLY